MFPINLELKGRVVLLVGAGRVGLRKLLKILKDKASVRLVEPRPTDEVRSLVSAGKVELFSNYCTLLLEGVDLVFVASSQAVLNHTVATEAREKGIWVNVADDPEGSDFTLPAVVEQGDFCLTVSTGKGSPALAAKVAKRLRHDYGPEYGHLTRLLSLLRPLVLNSALEPEQREYIFKSLAENKLLLELLAQGDTEAALAVVAEIVAPLDIEDIR